MDDADGALELYLFPLGLVLLPGEVLPLHIFEERYKRLVAHCRETGEPFGIVWHDGDAMAVAGCTARLAAILEELPDGQSNIVVVGERRFTLSRLEPPDDPEAEALRAVVDPLDDAVDTSSTQDKDEVSGLFERVLELMRIDEPDDPREGVAFSFRVAASLEIELPLKQGLLELRDEGERLRRLGTHLRAVAARLETIRSREDAIRGNGKGL